MTNENNRLASPENQIPPALRPFRDKGLVWIMGVALFTRFVACLIFWPIPHAVATDLTPRYERLAYNLFENFTYSEDPEALTSSVELPPGYPAFLALLRLTLSDSPHIEMLALALLGMLSCALAYACAYELIGARGAFLVGLGVAVDPTFVIFSLYRSHHGLYVLFLLLAIWALVQALARDRLWAWSVAGLAVGLAALAWRDALMFWLIAPLCLVLRRDGRARLDPRSVGRVLVFVAVFGAVVGLWVGRNYLVTKDLAFSTDAGRRWLENRHAAVEMWDKGLSREEAIETLTIATRRPSTYHQIDPELARQYRAEAILSLVSHPVALARLWGRGVGRSLLLPETDAMRTVSMALAPDRFVQLVFDVYYTLVLAIQCALLALIVIGAIVRRSWRDGLAWWGPVVVIAYFLPTMADLDAGAGHRFVIIPALIFLAVREGMAVWPRVARRFRIGPDGFGHTVSIGPLIDDGEEGGIRF